MNSKIFKHFILLCGLTFFCAYVNAETIYLKNGGIIHGKIVGTTKKDVIIDIGGGTVTQNSKTIKRIGPDITIKKTTGVVTDEVTEQVNDRVGRAPKPRSNLADIFNDLTNAIGSVLRGDFIKENK